MLHLTADWSIPKMHQDPEREKLSAITIHYDSIRIHKGTLQSIWAAPAGAFQPPNKL